MNDLGFKKNLYESQGVRYYITLDPQESTGTVRKLSESSVFEAQDPADKIVIQICDDCQLTIDLESVFA